MGDVIIYKLEVVVVCDKLTSSSFLYFSPWIRQAVAGLEEQSLKQAEELRALREQLQQANAAAEAAAATEVTDEGIHVCFVFSFCPMTEESRQINTI